MSHWKSGALETIILMLEDERSTEAQAAHDDHLTITPHRIPRRGWILHGKRRAQRRRALQ